MMIASIYFSALLCLGSGYAASIPGGKIHSRDLSVDLGYAVYNGFYNATTELNTWRGIRYAAAPTGKNRWLAPQAPVPHRNASIDATVFGPACPQSPPAIPGFSFPPGDEDCLFLNVYAPRSASQTHKLPVLVWIHGGGYGVGDGQQDISEIIQANGDGFVAVAIQYRLGAFGFLSSKEVEQSGVVNAGILDMEFALQWMQKNIGKFGGDETKVTISGESAGGGAVMLLGIARNGTLGTSLFQNAIASSPYLPPQYDFDSSIPAQRYQDFVSKAGCNGTQSLQCLRDKDSSVLQRASADISAAGTYGTFAFLPVTDLGFIASTPSRAFASNLTNGAAMLVGNNANEGPLFVPPTITTTADITAWLHLIFPSLSNSTIERILATYPSNSTASSPLYATNGRTGSTALDVSQLAAGQQQRANNLYAEATFVCPSYWLSDAFEGKGLGGWHYQYSVPVALHGDDLFAVFGPAAPRNQPDVLTGFFRRIWGGLVRGEYGPGTGGSPGSYGLVEWGGGADARMVSLNTTGGTPYQATTNLGAEVTQFENAGLEVEIVDAYSWEGGRGKRCEFWREIADEVPI